MSDSDSGGEAANPIPTLPLYAQLFLQAALSRRCFTKKTAEALYKRSCRITGATPGRFVDFQNTLHTALEPYKLAFKDGIDSKTGESYYCIVNTGADVVAQVATEFTPNELTFFRLLVEKIVSGSGVRHCATRSEAFDISGNLKPTISKTDTSAVLGALVLKGWLSRDAQRNIYTLSTRALIELEIYLDTFVEEGNEDATKCKLCETWCLDGMGCPNDACRVRLHRHCLARLTRAGAKCIECSTPWKTGEGTPIGSAAAHGNAAGSDNETQTKRRKSGVKGRKSNGTAPARRSKRQVSSQPEEEDDEINELEDDAQFEQAAGEMDELIDSQLPL